MHKGRSLGLDGMMVNFYLFVFDDIGPYLLNALMESLRDGILNIDQRQTVVKFIPKRNCDHRYVKNF